MTMVEVAWATLGLLAAATFGSFYYLGNKIDARFDALSARIDALTASTQESSVSLGRRIDELSGRIDDVSSSLGGRIDGLSARIDTHLREHHNL